MWLAASTFMTSPKFVVYPAGGDTRVCREMMCGCEKTADSGERMQSVGLVTMWISCVLYGALDIFLGKMWEILARDEEGIWQTNCYKNERRRIFRLHHSPFPDFWWSREKEGCWVEAQGGRGPKEGWRSSQISRSQKETRGRGQAKGCWREEKAGGFEKEEESRC